MGQQLFCRADAELGVGDVVARGVFVGILDGLRHDFNADDFFRFLSQQQGDRSRAAVSVHNGFVSGQTGVIQRKAV